MNKFDVLVSHSLTITSLHIYLTFTGMLIYVVGLFSQVTCAPELISKSVQSEIARSTRWWGFHKRRVKLKKMKKHLIDCVSNGY